MTMQYKGYYATTEFYPEEKLFHGTVIGINDVITFQSDKASELEAEFHASVDDYLAFCKELKQKPEKTYTGNLAIRATPELHKRIILSAKLSGKSMNEWVISVLEKVSNETLKKNAS